MFPQVAEAAHAWVVALLARWLAGRGEGRLWVSCDNPRHRDRIADELAIWGVLAMVVQDPPAASDNESPESAAERLAVFRRLAGGDRAVVVGPPGMWDLPAPSPAALLHARLALAPGTRIDPRDFARALDDAGFTRAERVDGHGQFATRGGIVDVFPWESDIPLRIEWFDQDIESLREFDVHSQQSRRRLKQAEFLLAEPATDATLAAYRHRADLHAAIADHPPPAAAVVVRDTLPDAGADDPCACLGQPVGAFDAGDFILSDALRRNFFDHLESWRRDHWRIAIVFPTRGEQERFTELAGRDLERELGVEPLAGDLLESFTVPALRIAILSSSELFGRYRQPGIARRGHLDRQRAATVLTAAEHLAEGDLVVHADYGIGRFRGTAEGDAGEELVLEYRDGAELRVPIEQAHLLSRYVGLGGRAELAKLGSATWKKNRQLAESSILDYAARLLRVQAQRQAQPGRPHPPDSRWMWEFENSFRFTETPDQLRAIAEVKRDMEAPVPMDRLICGDVGFGKTEVAIRAAFKAVTGGCQVAVLAPTTVLAEQHWRTFRERMSDYPVRIDLLNRFRSPAATRATLAGLADGSVDIVIGTHRLISGDVHFKRLGLVVVDEEQRFGVKHKERFKELFRQIDVLTLSATPIPRTLYLALMGARDMSTIDTPPPNRTPVHTTVAGYDERLIRDAITRELKRGGQVFFLHNRIRSIDGMRQRLAELVPAARIVTGHGRMDRDELELVMRRFVRGEADVLLATTIIETGIDIPNANTILIDRADRFGLADLYQLRGRVGRAGEQAYAILLLPRGMLAGGGDARRRIDAIRQYTALGSGFRIAMRDLEIRGAGNLLGLRQSGHIAAIGFDLYCQLLRQAVDRLQGRAVGERVAVAFRADFVAFREGATAAAGECLPAWLPSGWLPEAKLRVEAYRELAELADERGVEALTERWRDRFGRLPEPVRHLIDIQLVRVLAAARGVTAVEVRGQRLMLTRNRDYIMLEGRRFPRLKETRPARKLAEAIQLIRAL